MMKNILVTGCAGFIGSNFVSHYLTEHPEGNIIGLDNLTYAGNLENLSGIPEDNKKRFVFIKGDICESGTVEEVFRDYQIDGVVHFAAESHVDRSIEDPQVFLKTNILGTFLLLDAARRFWPRKTLDFRRFVQISTDEVYGSLGPAGYFTETTPLDPHSPYSASKASADHLASSYHDTYGLPVMITRCSNNYGPYQFPEKLIPLVIVRALQHEFLPVYGDGKQIRDWLYVIDHCRAVDRVLGNGIPGEVYNIGGNNERENIELVRTLVSVLRDETGDQGINESLIRHVADRPGHDRRYAIDSSKIRRQLGWIPETGFQEGIHKTVRWYLENRGWVERVVTGSYRTTRTAD
ncbi:MAG: dTDP-glucose 4,6-dehydratase [Methanoregulaceae archaeon]|jgi:dTDP-glucose 4,6-dehydratase